MAEKKRQHQDTSVSLHPLSFEEAIEALAQTFKHADSEAEESDNTKAHVLAFDSSEKRTAPRRKSSAD